MEHTSDYVAIGELLHEESYAREKKNIQIDDMIHIDFIDKDGIYRLTYSDLVNAGMNVSQLDPSLLHMTNQGRDVAIYIQGEEDGSLNEGDYIMFYGEKFRGDYMASLHTDEADGWLTYIRQFSDGTSGPWHPQFTAEMLEKYTDVNVYWLTIDTSGSPPRMEMVDGVPGSAPVPKSYTSIVHEEKDLRHWEYHLVTEDTWFWDWVQDSNEHVYTTTLSSITTEPFTATVRGELVAFTYNDFSSPDHHTVVKLNSQPTPINDAYWEGRSLYSFTRQVSSDYLVEGINQLIFQMPADTVSSPSIFFNWFEIEYQRLFMTNEDVIHFPGEIPGTWKYQTDGFTSSQVEALIITDPLMPKQIVNVEVIQTENGYRADFQVGHEVVEQFYLAVESAYLKPKSLTIYNPPDLKANTNQADYLIISHPNFMPEAQRLADYRSSQGLSSMVVSIDDIYNEFNEGIYHPIAIKNFLRYTLAAWEDPVPTYVVLVGDGHFNDKFVSPERYGSLPIYLPANLGWVDPWQAEVDTTNLLVTLVGDDILPDMIIGRMPVNSPEELSAIIDKTISFEQAPLSEWQLHNLFVADNTPDAVGDFVALSEELISSYLKPGFTADRVYLDTFTDSGTCGEPISGGPSCPAANHAITDTLSTTGAQFVTYTGHGHVVRWANEQIMLIHETDPYYNDVSTINNSDKLSVVLDMTCFTGYWFYPTYPLLPSLAETFLRTENRGAVATFSSTGRGIATGHDILSQGFFRTIYADGNWDLGTATLGAKLAVYRAGIYSDLINTYMIFGDPALRLHSPYNLTLSPEQESQMALAGSTVSYLIELTNTSAFTDTFEISMTGNSWSTEISSLQISLLPGEKSNFSVTVTIPEDILAGATDSVLVEVVSQGDRGKSDSVLLQTIGYVLPDAKIYVPFVVK